jgi:hypothetical protein
MFVAPIGPENDIKDTSVLDSDESESDYKFNVKREIKTALAIITKFEKSMGLKTLIPQLLGSVNHLLLPYGEKDDGEKLSKEEEKEEEEENNNNLGENKKTTPSLEKWIPFNEAGYVAQVFNIFKKDLIHDEDSSSSLESFTFPAESELSYSTIISTLISLAPKFHLYLIALASKNNNSIVTSSPSSDVSTFKSEKSTQSSVSHSSGDVSSSSLPVPSFVFSRSYYILHYFLNILITYV